jgi:hypothetical protein
MWFVGEKARSPNVVPRTAENHAWNPTYSSWVNHAYPTKGEQ